MSVRRRWSIALCTALLTAAAAAGLAVAGSSAPAQAPVAADQPAPRLPPLPAKPRPKLVEPVAGQVVSGTAVDEPPLSREAPRRKPGDDPVAADSPRRRARPATADADVRTANALPDGIALAPLEAPQAVRAIIDAGNLIARTPYKWGGGHGRWRDDGYDCSGSVSFVLAAAGLLDAPLASGPLMSWGEPGPGKWITIHSHAGHVFMDVAGIRFDTSGAGPTGSRWHSEPRSTAGFVARHPAGL